MPSKPSPPTYYKIISRLCSPEYCGELLRAIDSKLNHASSSEALNLLIEKVEIFRRLGLLADAIKLLEKICSNNSAFSKAYNLLCSLQGQSNSDTRTRAIYKPAPFIRQHKFLGNTQVEKLLVHVQSKSALFKPAGIGAKAKVNLGKRKTVYIRDLGEFRELFTKRIIDYCDTAAISFGMKPFTPSRIELKITNHLDEYFFNIHNDTNSLDNKKEQRAISFVYYFHRKPKSFLGGDLLLFDSDCQNNKYKNFEFTRLLCERDSLTYFPSEYFHCVDIVRQRSKKDFSDGRFAVTGHIRRYNPNTLLST